MQTMESPGASRPNRSGAAPLLEVDDLTMEYITESGAVSASGAPRTRHPPPSPERPAG